MQLTTKSSWSKTKFRGARHVPNGYLRATASFELSGWLVSFDVCVVGRTSREGRAIDMHERHLGFLPARRFKFVVVRRLKCCTRMRAVPVLMVWTFSEPLGTWGKRNLTLWESPFEGLIRVTRPKGRTVWLNLMVGSRA